MSDVNPVLEKFLHVMPLLGAMFSADIGVAVTDREKYLLYKPGRQLDLPNTAGTPLKQGTAIVRAMNENRRVSVRGDKATFGLPYIATAMPIHDENGAVVGGAVIIEVGQSQRGDEGGPGARGARHPGTQAVVGGTERDMEQRATFVAHATALSPVRRGCRQRAIPACRSARSA